MGRGAFAKKMQTTEDLARKIKEMVVDQVALNQPPTMELMGPRAIQKTGQMKKGITRDGGRHER